MLGVLAVVVSLVVVDDNCSDRVPVWRDGARDGDVCADDAERAGLLIVDLGDAWAPLFLDDDGGAPAPWRASFVALANERFDARGVGPRARRDRFLEPWGIPPAPAVLQRRLDDHARHACDDAVDDAALVAVPVPQQPSALGRPAARARAIARLLRRRDAGRAGADDLARLDALRAVDGVAHALVEHLVCEGLLLPADARGGFGPRALAALEAFQRREALLGVAGVLDDDTRERLLLPSRTRDWLALLRMVRERVADAAGIIEDGSAAEGQVEVGGQHLDPRSLRVPLRATPPADGAGDVLGAVTDQAVRALGLHDEARAALTLRALPRGRLAVPFVGRPAWHGPEMNLDVTIDPGDVDADGLWRAGMRRRPMLVVSAVVPALPDGATRRIALVSWPTTVGGWQRERLDDGAVIGRRKPSIAGEVVWAHVWAQPAWYAPRTTPDDELLLRVGDGVVVNDETIGPGYRSAYGLVMLPHERVRRQRLGASADIDDDALVDTAVRTHGTGNVRSVLRGGPSHGCHRLLPLHANRLATFLLRHRTHVRDGPVRQKWTRTFDDVDLVARRRLRGVRWRFLPPIPVRVLSPSPTPATPTPATPTPATPTPATPTPATPTPATPTPATPTPATVPGPSRSGPGRRERRGRGRLASRALCAQPADRTSVPETRATTTTTPKRPVPRRPAQQRAVPSCLDCGAGAGGVPVTRARRDARPRRTADTTR